MGDTRGPYRVILSAIMAMTLVGALVGGVVLVTRARDAVRAPSVEFAIGPGPGVVTLRAIEDVGERPFMGPLVDGLSIDPVRLVLQPRNAIAAESPSRRGSTADLMVALTLAPRLVDARDAVGDLRVDRIREVTEQAIGAGATVTDLLDADRDGFDDDDRFSVTALDGSSVCVFIGERRSLAAALSQSIDPIDDRPASGIGWTSHGPCSASSEPPTGTEVRVGTTPGTYGGLAGRDVCDAELLLQQLAVNPLVAESWMFVHTIDADLVRDFVASLTPVILLRDTLVTEHGFDNGRIHTLQVVLQRGTAVMVDRTGQPRVRCMSGAPLRAPQATMTESVVVVGEPWRGFTIEAVADIPAAEVPTTEFVLVDIRTGSPIVREPGDPTLAGPFASALGGG